MAVSNGRERDTVISPRRKVAITALLVLVLVLLFPYPERPVPLDTPPTPHSQRREPSHHSSVVNPNMSRAVSRALKPISAPHGSTAEATARDALAGLQPQDLATALSDPFGGTEAVTPDIVEAELRGVLLEGKQPALGCLTTVVEQAGRYFTRLSADGRKLASQVLFRPDSYPDFYSGVNIAYPEGVEVVKLYLEGYTVHYVRSGTQAASDAYANKASTLLPQIATHFSGMGFPTAPSDGNAGGGADLYDVYITDLPSGIAGFCSASGIPGQPWPSYVVISNKLAFNDVSTATTLSTTLAHEIFHSVQYAYDPAERSWWKEATAVWAQDEVFESINDYVLLLPERMREPHHPLDTTDGRMEYATVLWSKYLDEKFSGEAIIRRIWEKQSENRAAPFAENTIEGIRYHLELRGLTLGDALGQFGVWMYRKGRYEDGKLFPSVTPSGTVSEYPAQVFPSSLAAGKLGHLSVHIIEFLPPDGLPRPFSLTFDGDNSFPFSLTLLGVGPQGSQDLEEIVSLSAAMAGNYTLDGFGVSYTKVVAVVANSSVYLGNASYELSVTLAPPAEITVDKAELEFAASEGTDPEAQTISLGNSGEGPLDWTAITNVSWLTLSKTEGTLPSGQVEVLVASVSVDELVAEGAPYYATIRFSSPNAVNSPVEVDVTVEVIFGAPYMLVVPGGLVFSFVSGATVPQTESAFLHNNGAGEMRWSTGSLPDWLSATPAGGIISSRETVEVVFSVDTYTLAPTTEAYTAQVSFTSPDAANTPLSLPVSVSVYPEGTVAAATDAAGHIALDTPHDWQDISSSIYDITRYFTTLDDSAVGFYMPFAASFYGVSLTTEDAFYVSTNGFITFDSIGPIEADNTDFPDPARPNGVIAPFWADFDLSLGGRIYARAFDTETGVSFFVIQYDAVFVKGDSTPRTFQMLFFSTGDIIFRYQTGFEELTRGTVGIENTVGNDGLTVCYDEPDSFPASGTSILITLRGAGPIATLSEPVLHMAAQQGSSTERTVTVTNAGAGVLEWRLSADVPWLSFPVSEGTGNYEARVVADTAALATGQYAGTVTLSATNGFEWRNTSTLTLNVYNGAPSTQAIELPAGWGAAGIGLYPRDIFTVADVLAAVPHAQRVATYRNGAVYEIPASEASGMELGFGDALLLWCTEATSFELAGDHPVRRLVYYPDGLSLKLCGSAKVGELWEDMPSGAIQWVSPWQNGFRTRFAEGEGAGYDSGPVMLVRALRGFLLDQP